MLCQSGPSLKARRFFLRLSVWYFTGCCRRKNSISIQNLKKVNVFFFKSVNMTIVIIGGLESCKKTKKI